VLSSAGCFTEKLFRVAEVRDARSLRKDAPRKWKLRWSDAISLKGLVHPSNHQPLPKWYTLGAAVEGQSEDHKRRAMLRAIRVLYPGQERWFYARGIRAAPRWAGGSGLVVAGSSARGSGQTVAQAAQNLARSCPKRFQISTFSGLWAIPPADWKMNRLLARGVQRVYEGSYVLVRQGRTPELSAWQKVK
jgi:hypothetical protein